MQSAVAGSEAAKCASGHTEDGLSKLWASRKEAACGSASNTGAGDHVDNPVDFSVLRNCDTLGHHQIELGWKKNRLVVHGDVLRLKTAMPTREYYPGGEIWSAGAAPGTDARSDRMSALLCAVTLLFVLFSAFISYLTSSPS